MVEDVFIAKGMKVRVKRFVPQPIGTYSLAGAQPKLSVSQEIFDGTVTHVYGDHPTKPTKITIMVQKVDGKEVEVDPKHIDGIIA